VIRLLVVSRNRKKLAEMRRVLDAAALTGVDLVSLDDVGPFQETPETGATFEENALAKARDAFAATGLASVADDSGLQVDALNGMPGVLSARWAGVHGDGSVMCPTSGAARRSSRPARWCPIAVWWWCAVCGRAGSRGSCAGRAGLATTRCSFRTALTAAQLNSARATRTLGHTVAGRWRSWCRRCAGSEIELRFDLFGAEVFEDDAEEWDRARE
jgi:hypothetical protein